MKLTKIQKQTNRSHNHRCRKCGKQLEVGDRVYLIRNPRSMGYLCLDCGFGESE